MQSAEARAALLRDYYAGPVLPGAPAWPLIQALGASWPPSIEALAQDELAAALLQTTPIYPIGLERALTAVRRRLLLEGVSDAAIPLVANLAIQGHLNEYAWATTPEEQARIAELIARLETLGPVEVMLVAAYAPLRLLPGAEALTQRRWTGPVAQILAEQVAAPAEEARLAAQIEALTPIEGAVSKAVRGQYEANPFPRWRTPARPDPATAIYGIPVPAAPQVLIAGCGTGYQAIIAAQRFPAGQVTALDLSRASLAYGQRKARELGLANIGFHQADLLQIGAMPWRFDIIESTGVLHHMDDPFAGARAVCALLKPGGLMKFALYSAAARAALKPAKALGRRFTPQQIPQFRQAIAAAPEGDPVREPLRFIDFYATSPCRDLLMHVQEHELGIADIGRILDENGLDLVALAVPEAVSQAYAAMFPDDPAMTDLEHWQTFETRHPTTFSEMYQFWTRKRG